MRLDRRSFRIWLVASVVWLPIAGGWSYLRASADLVQLQIDHRVMFPQHVTLVPCGPLAAAHEPSLLPSPHLWGPEGFCLGMAYDPALPTLIDAVVDNWAAELTAAYVPPLLFYVVGLWMRRRDARQDTRDRIDCA